MQNMRTPRLRRPAFDKLRFSSMAATPVLGRPHGALQMNCDTVTFVQS
jgi:hypothetical protein